MSKRNHGLQLPSLLDYFEAPDGFQGLFGWVCGYSADAPFMDQAAERFSRRTHAQRAFAGNVSLALLLDPGNAPLSIVDVPGVAHCLFKAEAKRPFALLHAKVALLGFRHEKDPQTWRIRLVVSTGNWTSQTVEDSLDLAWCVELASEDLSAGGDEVARACADLRAAADFFRFLRPYFDARLIEQQHHGESSESAAAAQRLESWMSRCQRLAKGAAPRFIDNRAQSLLSQLTVQIRTHGNATSRNYLAMGSGFYESATTAGAGSKVPAVLDEVVTTLQQESLLAQRATLDVFVNPAACQAVALALEALQESGFTVRPAGQTLALFGPNSSRSLHAKFLFSARRQENSNACNSAWLYLGSGNLTGPGFLQRMHVERGNLEAGVIFSPPGLEWKAQPDTPPEALVTNVLPLQWRDELASPHSLQCGEDMPDRPEDTLAPPVGWLVWEDAAEGGSLLAEVDTAALDVLDSNGLPCPKAARSFYWTGERPRQVRLRWHHENQARESVIPVIDPAGRIAATPLPALDMEEAWWQLANFPSLPDDDELEDDTPPDPPSGSGGAGTAGGADVHYPVRQMMALVEHIAATQVDLPEADWITWCHRLEQTLLQLEANPTVAYFRHIKLNPLSPLLAAPFRSEFAERPESASGRRYEAVLARVMAAWKVEALPSFGVAP